MGLKKIDWGNRIIEVLLIVVGILMAFQLNQCAERSSQKDLINNHLKYVEIESKENVMRLSGAMEHIRDQLKNCELLLSEIKDGRDANQIRSYATSLLDLRNVSLIDDAYQVLVESGDIRYIKDYQKKRSVISMYESFEEIEKINVSHQNLYDNHYYPYLNENFDLVNWNQLNLNSEEEERYYSSIFANTISTYNFLLKSKLRTYEAKEKLVKNYLKE